MNKAVFVSVVIVLVLFIVIAMGAYFLSGRGFLGQKQESFIPTPEVKELSNNAFTVGNMLITTITEGAGVEAKNGNAVKISYHGETPTGTAFDSSQISFTLGKGEVIGVFDFGVIGMKVGEERRVVIPKPLVEKYGPSGNIQVPPDTTLFYYIKLLEIK